mgnify:CR=1 FL=1|jgi:ParB-like chromosome segregation protein Spo0J
MINPIDGVEWIARDLLKPNHYNPNVVAPLELELLKQSIKQCGWTQPIVIRENFEIVDGFHRWIVSGDAEIGIPTEYKVPCVRLPKGVSDAEQMAATITHNRARGTHHVLKMADIVRMLRDKHKVSEKWVSDNLGMENEEIERLYDNSGSPDIIGQKEFNKGWGLDEGRFDT